METLVRRVYLQSKNMGIFFFVPLVGYYVLIPLLLYAMEMHPVSLEVTTIDRFSEVCYITVPVLSVLWSFMQLRSQVENEVGEILFVYRGAGMQTVAFYILNVLCFVPALFFFDDSDGMLMALFLQMALIGFLLNGMVLFISLTLKSISLAVLIVVMYHLLSTRFEEFFGEFRYGMMQGNIEWQQQGTTLLVAGVVFWILGFRMSKRI